MTFMPTKIKNPGLIGTNNMVVSAKILD